MVKKRWRRSVPYKFRIALEALECSNTVSQCLNDRAPVEECITPWRWQTARRRSEPAASVWMHLIPPFRGPVIGANHNT